MCIKGGREKKADERLKGQVDWENRKFTQSPKAYMILGGKIYWQTDMRIT